MPNFVDILLKKNNRWLNSENGNSGVKFYHDAAATGVIATTLSY